MTRIVQDRLIPPDHSAFVAAEPPSGRIIVIAPTRAACETIEIAVGLHLDTYLERTHGQQVRDLAKSGRGFGIVAGTGTGKTLAIRPIAEELLQVPLKIGVVNREREATPELPDLNVIVVTTGIARRWFQDGDILVHDTLIVDEIHQTSAELELCLALGKRVGCRFIWLSATVDPGFYRRYLNSGDVLQVYSFDPARAAEVRVIDRQPLDFLDETFLRQMVKSRRGVGVFLPTRAAVEQAAATVTMRSSRIHAAFYHGGEPVSAIRPFLEDSGAEKPYLLAMTAAGQSALNVQGLDTVVIEDSRFSNVITSGRNVLTRQHLGSNEILQMAGRVHGRVAGGRVFILSDRHIDFAALKPTAPEFQLAGNSERVALTCADLGVRADELELPVALDKTAYRRAYAELQHRGIIAQNGRLTDYGKAVEALPVDRAWAELIINADDDLVAYLGVMSSIESLHRMTRDERNLHGLAVAGSDHLTSYNLYAEAFQAAGIMGEVYGLHRHLFDGEAITAWADERGVLIKAIEDSALALAGLFRSVGLALPSVMPLASDRIARRFTDLLAQYMPFDLVIDEHTADGRHARVSKSSMCGKWGAIAGTLRYFADRFGVPRASIEGTQLRTEQVRRHAHHSAPRVVYDARLPLTPLVNQQTIDYFGFELEREGRPLTEFSNDIMPQAHLALAAALARGEARHEAVHKNRSSIDQLRQLYRRSGGTIAEMDEKALTAHYARLLDAAHVASLAQFRDTPLPLRMRDFVTAAQASSLLELPATVQIAGRAVTIDYDIENSIGIARLQLPEKLARGLAAEALPRLDRPLRFEVSRGRRGAIRAATLPDLKRMLEGPWSPNVAAPATDEEAEGAPQGAAPAANTSRGGQAHGHRKPPLRGIPRGGGRFARSSGHRTGGKRRRK